jgi:hypothetical protein
MPSPYPATSVNQTSQDDLGHVQDGWGLAGGSAGLRQPLA